MGAQDHVEAIDLAYLLLAVLSIILNGLMVYITCLRRHNGWPLDVIFLLMIGVADLLAGLVAVVLQIWKFNSNYEALFNGSPWCFSSAIGAQGAQLTILNLTALLALVRYLAIVRGRTVSNLTWTVAGLSLTVICWVSLTLKEFGNKPEVGPSGLFCSSMGSRNIFINMMLFLILVPPILAIPACYYLLTRHFHIRLNQLRKTYGSDVPRRFLTRFRGLAIVVIGYVLTIFPEFILGCLIMFFRLSIPAWLAGMGRMCTFSLTIVNAVFALIYHDDINRELVLLMERYDSNSQDRISHHPPDVPDVSPKRDPNRTSTFLYFQ